MRKRLLSTAILVALFGMIASLSFDVGFGGADYHRRNYWTAFYESGSLERLRAKLMRLLRRPINRIAQAERREKRLTAHEARLIKLGYLEQRNFDVFGNHPNTVVLRLVRQEGISASQRNTPGRNPGSASFRLVTTQDEIVRVTSSDGYRVTVVAPKTNMREWEHRIRRADRVDAAIQ